MLIYNKSSPTHRPTKQNCSARLAERLTWVDSNSHLHDFVRKVRNFKWHDSADNIQCKSAYGWRMFHSIGCRSSANHNVRVTDSFHLHHRLQTKVYRNAKHASSEKYFFSQIYRDYGHIRNNVLCSVTKCCVLETHERQVQRRTDNIPLDQKWHKEIDWR